MGGGLESPTCREGGHLADDSAAVGEETVHLRDGRSLAYATWGHRQGKPVFLFHGSPSSRLFRPSPSVTASFGVRLITVDRPGFGASDFQKDRRLLDWPDDVAQLADALEIERFAIVGHSNGGPFALACAVKIPSRLTSVGLVSTVVPLNEITGAYDELVEEQRRFADRAREDPANAAESIAQGARWLIENPGVFLEAPRPEPDRRLLEEPGVHAMFLESVRESARQGLEGYAWDEVLCTKPWGFSLADSKVSVHLWHGDQDPYIPRAHVDYMVSLLPECEATFYPDEAHGVIVSRWEEILTRLIS